MIYVATLIILFRQTWMVTTFYLNMLILGTVCDVLYECMLNSTAKLRINQLLSYPYLK